MLSPISYRVLASVLVSDPDCGMGATHLFPYPTTTSRFSTTEGLSESHLCHPTLYFWVCHWLGVSRGPHRSLSQGTETIRRYSIHLPWYLLSCLWSRYYQARGQRPGVPQP